MTSNTKAEKAKQANMLVVVTGVVFIAITTVFFIQFVAASQQTTEAVATLTADSYLSDIEPLLAGANVERGEALINQYECHVCHVQGGGQIAPLFTGIAQRAALERPPLQASAYLYEAIMHPAAYVVPDYANAMPANYPDRLKPQEVGDIVAYLLTQ